MVSRFRAAAWLPLVGYLAATVLGPALHERHHALYGADHEHTAAGTIYHAHHHDAAAASVASVADVHARFDDDLVMLDLVEVAEAGALSVDCAFVEYTLATCAPDEPHAHRFGDQLRDSDTSPHESPPDPEHHRFSVEHLAAPVLVARAPSIVCTLNLVHALPIGARVFAVPALRVLPARSRAPPRSLTET